MLPNDAPCGGLEAYQREVSDWQIMFDENGKKLKKYLYGRLGP